ncbi:mevalonate kinase [Streptococcus pneumoniae]|nr:mevalonate kinase [Streptococcus pneumoniae]
MTKKVGVGQAHSKIILIGEHAVVYGYPAISLPLLEVEVTCKVVSAESPWRLYEEDTLSMAVYASLEYLDITEACVRCEIDSAIPEKRGMGSSAAISIAAIRAVFDYYQAEEFGHKLLPLPPYSPEYNPIEKTWAHIKKHLKKVLPSCNTFYEAFLSCSCFN